MACRSDYTCSSEGQNNCTVQVFWGFYVLRNILGFNHHFNAEQSFIYSLIWQVCIEGQTCARHSCWPWECSSEQNRHNSPPAWILYASWGETGNKPNMYVSLCVITMEKNKASVRLENYENDETVQGRAHWPGGGGRARCSCLGEERPRQREHKAQRLWDWNTPGMSEQSKWGSVSGDEVQENTGWGRELVIYGLVDCN